MSDSKRKGVIAWFAYNPVAANLLMFITLALGLYNAGVIRTEGFPEGAPRTVTITVDLRGSSPDDAEEGVVIKIEEALKGVAGIKEVTATMSSSKAQIFVVAIDGYPIEALQDDVKVQVDAINTFPQELDSIVITAEQEDRNVIQVQISGDTDHRTLSETAKRIRARLLSLTNINRVDMLGKRVPEIAIELSVAKLREYKLTSQEVAAAIQRESLNLSAGDLRTNGQSITLQTRAQAYRSNDFTDIIIRTDNSGGEVRLKDVAAIQDGYSERALTSEFGTQPSINLNVLLIGRESITEASDRVKREVIKLQREPWVPETISIKTWADEAENINGRLGLLATNGLLGILFVLIVLALFLDTKIAFWVAIGIPISFAGTLTAMGPWGFDFSLNELTTFAFIIVLGIVVDDAIIIGESIYTFKQEGDRGVNTAIDGARAVSTPATFGVLTTVAAFFPLTLISGDFGGPFKLIAIVTIVCLLFSLVESKLILPSHLAHVRLRKDKRTERNQIRELWRRIQARIERTIVDFVDHKYLPILRFSIRNRTHVFLAFIALLVLVFGLITGGLVRSVFFSQWQSDLIFASIEMESTVSDQYVERQARAIRSELVSIGRDFQKEYNHDQNPVESVYVYAQDKKIDVRAELIAGEKRQFMSSDVTQRWRESVDRVPGIKQQDIFAGFKVEEDLHITFTSINPENAILSANELSSELKKYTGVYDIQSNLDNTNTELEISLTPESHSLGISKQAVTEQVRNMIFGFEAQRIQRDSDDVRVQIRLDKPDRDDSDDLNNLRILTESGATIPLTTVANLTQHQVTNQLSREDGNRIYEVKAKVHKELISPNEIINDLDSGLFKTLSETFPDVTIKIGGESESQDKATVELAAGFILGLVIIYALLAIPLKSYFQPLVILGAVPFGIVGAVAGHWIIGIPLTILSFFGILALTGVVVNDALVLTSAFNEFREKGANFENSIVAAGQRRFRAIILTSVTTFVGLFPLILEKSEQAQMLIPMAVSLAFGILFATVITLLIVPVMLGLNYDVHAFFCRMLNQRFPKPRINRLV